MPAHPAAREKGRGVLAGTYLAAAIDDATLLDRTPEGLACQPEGLSEEDVAFLQCVAWAAVQDGLDASELQLEIARRRLAERLAAGTAELVLGGVAARPWEFKLVKCLKPTLSATPAQRMTADASATGGAGRRPSPERRSTGFDLARTDQQLPEQAAATG